MEACGFSAYECEWWHFTLTAEPYPDTYFDLPITRALLDDIDPSSGSGAAPG